MLLSLNAFHERFQVTNADAPFVGVAPFVLYLLMVAGVFFVAGAVRIKSKFRAMIPPVTVRALVGGLMILVLSDAGLAALPAPGP